MMAKSRAEATRPARRRLPFPLLPPPPLLLRSVVKKAMPVVEAEVIRRDGDGIRVEGAGAAEEEVVRPGVHEAAAVVVAERVNRAVIKVIKRRRNCSRRRYQVSLCCSCSLKVQLHVTWYRFR
jgi:hypothetical protein